MLLNMKFLNFFSLNPKLRDESIKDSDILTLADKKNIFNFFFILEDTVLTNQENIFFYKTSKLDYLKNVKNIIFIGKKKNHFFFCRYISYYSFKSEKIFFKTKASKVRDAINFCDKETTGIITSGFLLSSWIKENKYCGKCGNKTKVVLNGHLISCNNRKCKNKLFPRINPVIIVMVKHKGKILQLVQSLPEQDITDIKFYTDKRERVEFLLCESFGDTSTERTMDLLSDGTLKVLGIATALLSVPKGSTVVIEEIDNSIHPNRANEILSLIRQYAEERSLNLLLSTHNPALMDALPDEALADVVFCYRDPQQGDSKLVRLGDLDNYLGLVAQGSLGDLVTQGVVERFVKHPTTSEERKQQALNWLNQLKEAD